MVEVGEDPALRFVFVVLRHVGGEKEAVETAKSGENGEKCGAKEERKHVGIYRVLVAREESLGRVRVRFWK